jgi:tetratricopeptide (TPR) repeat protein
MPRFSLEELRFVFANSADFNDMFEAFQDALEQRIKDIELYRLLFWNNALSPDELCLFGGKLAKEFPGIAYDTYMWLARVFEVTYSAYDNFELALLYYRKASESKPTEADPYLDACDCHDADLNIPPREILIDFVKGGIKRVPHKKSLMLRLSRLYELEGDEEQSEYYRRLADEQGPHEA